MVYSSTMLRRQNTVRLVKLWTLLQERARMAHALSLAEVVDITDLHESEESWWNVYVHSVVDATLLEPHLERERHVALSKARKASWGNIHGGVVLVY